MSGPILVDPTLAAQARLREPFPAEAVGKLPRKGKRKDGTEYEIQLDFVGHGFVTERLLDVDPEWTWEPAAKDPETGAPILDHDAQGVPRGMWIRLTVCGVTRWGYGSVEAGKAPENVVKEIISDGIRNAAMRFGVALDLWKKGSRDGTNSTGRGKGKGDGVPKAANSKDPVSLARAGVIAAAQDAGIAPTTAARLLASWFQGVSSSKDLDEMQCKAAIEGFQNYGKTLREIAELAQGLHTDEEVLLIASAERTDPITSLQELSLDELRGVRDELKLRKAAGAEQRTLTKRRRAR